MKDRLQQLDRLISACNYHLNKAEDMHDVDAFNHWYSERSKLQMERSELLNIRIGVYGF